MNSVPVRCAALIWVSLLALAPMASAQDHNFAGSVQASYLWTDSGQRRGESFDGFVNELSVKLAADVNEDVSGSVKMCHGCHGVEVGMAYLEARVADAFAIRAGRFSPAFGDFPLRHDPANHATGDKPLPYDMGRMVRMRDWNLGVVPAPYVDNGIEVNGTHWFGDTAQFDYAVYAVAGLRGSDDASDLDFAQSRALYYIDNNSEPAFGGRLALTLDLAREVTVALGARGMSGRYDPSRDLRYSIVGLDFYLRIGPLDLRFEALGRRTDIALGDAPQERYRYGPVDGEWADYTLKTGFYGEAFLRAHDYLELVVRMDGLRRAGNLPLGSTLRRKSEVHRYTFGFNLVYESLRLKVGGEFYDFSDFDDELVFTGAIAASF